KGVIRSKLHHAAANALKPSGDDYCPRRRSEDRRVGREAKSEIIRGQNGGKNTAEYNRRPGPAFEHSRPPARFQLQRDAAKSLKPSGDDARPRRAADSKIIRGRNGGNARAGYARRSGPAFEHSRPPARFELHRAAANALKPSGDDYCPRR